jgi:hypothetical protein
MLQKELKKMTTEQEAGRRRFTQEELDELGRLGDEQYARLRETIEPGNEGKFVAIHVDTGEYAIGKSATDASRALRSGRSPDGRMHVQKIGNEPDWELAHIFLAGSDLRK